MEALLAEISYIIIHLTHNAVRAVASRDYCTMARLTSLNNTHYFQRLFRQSFPVAEMVRASSTIVTLNKSTEMQPLSAMPGPKGTVHNMLDYALSKGSFFDVLEKRFKKYGPIYNEKLMDTRVVSISHVDAMTEVLRFEKTFQMRPGFEAVAEIVEETGGSLGLASNDYDTWYPDRSLLSPKLLRPKDVSGRYSTLNSVANDFVERVPLHMQPDRTINNIEEELSFWTVESFAAFLFDQRLGFYNYPPDPKAVEFVDAARVMLDRAGKMLHGAPFYKYIKTPTYYSLKKSISAVQTSGLDILKSALVPKQDSEKTNRHKQSLFGYLFSNNSMNSPEKMTLMLIGLMSAGIDSTSATCLWLLYELSRYPDIQEKLYQELLTTIGPEEEVTASNVPSYLKATLKKSQRLYPVVGYVIPRVFHKDFEVLGYNIPAGKLT